MSSSTLPHRPAKETTSQPTAASDPGSEPDDSLLVNEEDDEEGWQSVGEEEFSDEASTCPFCSKEFLSSKIVFAHCAASDDVDGHGFDIGKYAKEKGACDEQSIKEGGPILRKRSLTPWGRIYELQPSISTAQSSS